MILIARTFLVAIMTMLVIAPGEAQVSQGLFKQEDMTFNVLRFANDTSPRYPSGPITLSLKNVALDKALQQIADHYSLRLWFSGDLAPQKTLVTVELKEASFADAMKAVLANTDLEFIVSEAGQLIVTRRERVMQETGTISGRILQARSNKPIPGANVVILGTGIGAAANAEGYYRIERVPPGNFELRASAVGFAREQRSITIVAGQAVPADFFLEEATIGLDEVVVIGYGVTSERLKTGNVSSVRAEQIEKLPVQNALLALQGTVPGVFVNQNSGIAGAGLTIRVQGQNSIGNGSDPLYVIDGVFINPQLPPTGVDKVLQAGSPPRGFTRSNPLNYLNPADIERIDVLKDADATAIYGSLAANGAILITTKKGNTGPLMFNLDIKSGRGMVASRMDMLNTQQYLEMRKEAIANDNLPISATDDDVNGTWDQNRYTDWQKELLGGAAEYTDVNATLSGGSPTLRYRFSGTYHRETTVFPLPKDFSDQKGSLSLDLASNSLDQRLRIQFTANYLHDKNQLPQEDLTWFSLMLAPNAPPLYKSDGSLNWEQDSTGRSTWRNPLRQIYRKYENKTANFVGNLAVGYEFMEGFEVSASASYTFTNTDDFSAEPNIAQEPEFRPTYVLSAAYGKRNLDSWTIEPLMSYKTTLGGGKLQLLMGSTFLENNSNAGYIWGVGYPNDQVLENPISASTIYAVGSTVTQYKYNAFFGRVNYNWADKYLLNVNARRDGSSRFGMNNRFHTFASVAGAWIFSDEEFLKNPLSFLSFGKLQASYGTTGSDQIGDYAFMSLYNPAIDQPVPYQGVLGFIPSGLPNPDLQWEESRKLQFGLSLGFLEDRILVSANYARNRSSNQLLSESLPWITGFPSVTKNFSALVQNTSWEFSVTSINYRGGDFEWTSSVNLTIPKNQLVGFPDLSSSPWGYRLILGQSIRVLRLYHFLGVDPGTGLYLFSDSQGNPTTTPNPSSDATVFTDTEPQLYGGIQNSIRYKNIRLDFLIQFVKQMGESFFYYNLAQFPGEYRGSRGWGNQPVSVLNRWRNPGDNAAIAKFSTTANDYAINSSDYFIRDASYIRLKNLTVSYELPAEWYSGYLQHSRVYLEAQNLLTITSYEGLDPETRRLEYLPPLRVVTFGLQVGW